MSKFKKHTKHEMAVWERTQANELAKIRAAQRHLVYNVVAYLVISIIEYWLAAISRSQTLRADAFNNLSGIISTVLLMIGLHIAQDVDDDDIIGAKLPAGNYQDHMGSDQRVQFVRWRYETIFSLVTAVVMIAIALSVFIDGIKALLNPSSRVGSPASGPDWGWRGLRHHVGGVVHEPTDRTEAAKRGPAGVGPGQPERCLYQYWDDGCHRRRTSV